MRAILITFLAAAGWGLCRGPAGRGRNVTNRPQFDELLRNLAPAGFGRITNTLNDGRILQVGLRLVL